MDHGVSDDDDGNDGSNDETKQTTNNKPKHIFEDVLDYNQRKGK